MTFQDVDDLNRHILIDQHHMEGVNQKRSTNDHAKIHLIERLKLSHSTSQAQVETILMNQRSSEDQSNSVPLAIDKYTNYFATAGWGLRVRKPPKRINEKVRTFIE